MMEYDYLDLAVLNASSEFARVLGAEFDLDYEVSLSVQIGENAVGSKVFTIQAPESHARNWRSVAPEPLYRWSTGRNEGKFHLLYTHEHPLSRRYLDHLLENVQGFEI